ncbi:biotin transporter BioY [Priestia abyssalis]|uniref:biotin transporter BioY n=1 Tax=Priestia abyssalis TaxID=1221450 RepID=UPI00099592DE|nr:biotin transporter BioY [Priestia abyssalis]
MLNKNTYLWTVCLLFIGLMGISANITPYLKIGGIPVTLQLLLAILAGGMLGSKLGMITMHLYVLIGLAGAPIFAEFKGGIDASLNSTFGFVLSFILVAYITGKVIERQEVPTFLTYMFASLLGLLTNYMIGTNYMYAAFQLWTEAPEGFNYRLIWSWILLYLPLDILVAVLSASILFHLRKAPLFKNLLTNA